MILWARRRMLWHLLASVKRESKLKVAVVSVSALLVWLGMFAFAGIGFFLFESLGSEDFGVGSLTVGDVVMSRLLSVFALTLFAMLIFSNVLTAFATFYRAREVPPQLLAPISTTTFFFGRFRECLSMSSFASAFLGSPVMLAYGLMSHAPWIFYPSLVAFFVPFVVIPAAIGSILTMALVAILGHVRRAHVVGLGFIVVAILFGFFRGKLIAPDFSDTTTVQAILSAMSRTQSPFLPSHWLAQGVLGVALGQLKDAGFYFLLLASNAAFFLYLATLAAEAWFHKGYSSLYGGDHKRPTGRGIVGRVDVLFRWLSQPTQALVVKDFKLFWRDPAQWSQFVIFFGIMALYIANLGGARSFTSRWIEVTTILNMAACMLILASLTSRFVYPLISLEGPRIWILGLAPVGMRRIVWQKFWLSVATTSIFTVGLMVLSAWRLQLDKTAFLFSVTSIAATTLALSGLSVGLGSLYPNFREDNPSKIVSGMGGTLNFILSMLYIVVVTLAFSLVVLWKPSWPGLMGDRTQLVAVVASAIGALTFFACWVPLRLGMRNLERTEF
jgi:ABC-2 type transport system permease protein